MAVIGRIRKHTGWLILVIALAMIGFLLMDSIQSNSSILSRNPQANVVGEVDGSPIDYTEWDARYQQYRTNFSNRNEGRSPESSEDYLIRDQVWTDLVKEKLYAEIYDELGLNITDAEILDMLMGKSVHPEVRRAFTNPENGQFNPEFVRTYVSNLDTDEQGQEPGQKRREWNNFVDELTKTRLEDKYRMLVYKSMYVPSWMGKSEYESQNTAVSFDFVQVPFASIADSEIKLTDTELQSYLKDHQAMFKQDANRQLKMVFFQITPSAKDSAKALAYIADKLEAFKEAKSDSMYVNAYSEKRFESVYFRKADFPMADLTDTIFSMQEGDIIGPIATANGYEMIKMTDRKMMSDSVKVRQILFANASIKTLEERDAKLKLIDSVYMLLDSLGGDFATLAAMYSDDPESKDKGGDMGWVKFGALEQAMNDQIFYRSAPGKVARAFSSVGLHIIEVVQEAPSEEGVKVSFLTKSIIPSSETEKNIYKDASVFAGTNKDKATFETAFETVPSVLKRDVNKVALMDYNIFGVGEARSLVKWAYEAKEGDVSPVISLDGRHVVACIIKATEEGVPALAEIKDQVAIALSNQKKAELLSAKSLEQIASTYGVEVEKAEGVTEAAIPEDLNLEPMVVSVASVLSNGASSKAIIGLNGLYMVKLNAKTPAAELPEYSPFKAKVQSEYFTKMTNDLLKGIKSSADIQDDRQRFY